MKIREYLYLNLIGCEITLSEMAIQRIETHSDSDFKILTNEGWVVMGYENFPFSGMWLNIKHYENGQFARMPESYIMECEVTGIKFR